MANGSLAPVCPVSRSQVPSGMPGIMLPNMPRAVDLLSAIVAANQAARLLQTAFTPGRVSNNMGSGVPQSGGATGVHKKVERWKEKKRKTNTIRFYATDTHDKIDKTQWVDVERIVSITWHDKVQKIDLTFEWPYEPDEGSKLLKVDGKNVAAQ